MCCAGSFAPLIAMVSLSSGEFITTVNPRQTCCARRLPAQARRAEIKSRRGNARIDTSVRENRARIGPRLFRDNRTEPAVGLLVLIVDLLARGLSLGRPSVNQMITSGWKVPNFRWYFSSEISNASGKILPEFLSGDL